MLSVFLKKAFLLYLHLHPMHNSHMQCMEVKREPHLQTDTMALNFSNPTKIFDLNLPIK